MSAASAQELLPAPSAESESTAPATDPVSATFPVSAIQLRYADPHPDQPALGALFPIEVELERTSVGWAAPSGTGSSETLRIGGANSAQVDLEASGLARTLRAIVAAVHAKGLYGVDVRPSSNAINLETEVDLRSPGDSSLPLVVTLGRIGQVRTIAVGSRVRSDWKIDHELHDRIREDSPLQATGQSAGDDEKTTDLLDRDALEEYLYRLNRHPGRRVEAALSPGEDPGEIVVDYRVAEARPWFVYAQSSNTGTKRTSGWQNRFGVVHRQLTNRDDVLSLEYLHGGADVNGFRAQYAAPFFGAKRPDWMNRRKGDPALLDFIPREKIPWWGIDRLRWEVDVSYGRFEAGREATDIFRNDAVVSEQLQFGGRFVYEAWQHKNFFLDVWAGLRIRDLRVNNKILRRVGEETLVLPRAGIHGQRINAVSNLSFDFGVEGQVDNLNLEDREQLGRQDIDANYAVLDFNFGYSTYLEPILFPTAFKDPETRLSSTLAHELALGVRGQYGFDYRLIPQASQVIGGLYSVRGHRQSQAVGDTVIISSLEYRFHFPRALPIMREPLNIPLLGDFRITPQQVYGRPDWDLTLRAFIDVGRAIRNANNAAGPNVGNFERDETLVGVGVGAELQLRSNLRARLDWATPLTVTPRPDQDRNSSFGAKSEVHLLFSILF